MSYPCSSTSFIILLLTLSFVSLVKSQCPAYQDYSSQRHEPFSKGRFNLSYTRPVPQCRSFKSQELENTLGRLKSKIKDPDLYRIFENCWPSTLDTTIAWRGFAADPDAEIEEEQGDVQGAELQVDNISISQTPKEKIFQATEDSTESVQVKPHPEKPSQKRPFQSYDYLEEGPRKKPSLGGKRLQQKSSSPGKPLHRNSKRLPTKPSPTNENDKEELSFIITGDIEAMWLRDSANQLQAYTSILTANTSTESLASLFRGAINLQARYILEHPFCNAFQAPLESNITRHSSANSDQISPSYDYYSVFSCQWELDSVASFLQLSHDYVTATNDYEFFGKWRWKEAVRKILETAESMTIDSYTKDGEWQHTSYTYCAPYGGTPINECNGSPHKGNIGLIRSFHRPSDDACTYQYLIPSNMMFSATLNTTSKIMDRVEGGSGEGNLTMWMQKMSSGIHHGIERHARVADRTYGTIYAFEVDGYGSANIMDDPNIPSLLSAPFLKYLDSDNPIYQNTRRKILSKDNPYYSWGPIITGVGSPHTLPGRAWPMALIMGILTSDDDEETVKMLRDLVKSTDGLGLMHESVDSHVEGLWSRQWFSWANGMFGQAILDLEKRRPHILEMSFQKD